MQINEFTLKNLDECTSLFISVYEKEPWNDKWESFESARQYLLELIENPVFSGHVAVENEKIVGASFGHKRRWWQGVEFYIDEFYISHDLQRKGIGKMLMNHIKEWLAAKNIYTIALLTEKGNLSESFYLKENFEIKSSIQFMFYNKKNKNI